MSRLTVRRSIPSRLLRETFLFSTIILLVISSFPVIVKTASGELVSRRGQPITHGIEVRQEQEVRTLEPGMRIERDLAGRDVHFYRIATKAGQFLRVIVDQHGVDVSVALYQQGGARLVEVDSANGSHGPEPVSVVSEKDAIYDLAVRWWGKASAGRYEIRIEELRKAVPQDRDRVNAERTLMEAMQLLGQEKTGSLLEATGRCEKSLALFHALADSLLEGIALIDIAAAYDWLGDNEKTIDYRVKSLPFLRQLGDHAGEIDAIVGIGESYFYMGELQEALDYLNQARGLIRKTGIRTNEARALHDMGAVFRLLGDNQKALDFLNEALKLRRLASDRRGEARTLTNIGAVYDNMGMKARALDSYNAALERHRDPAAKSRWGEAYTLTNIGKIYFGLRDHSRALEYLNQAYQIRLEVQDHYGEAITLHGMGQVYEASAEYQQALNCLNRSLTLRRAVGDRYGEAVTLYEIARVHRVAGGLVEALSQVESAINIIEALRAKIISQELRASYFASEQGCFEFYIALLMQLHKQDPSRGYDSLALRVSERARARVLVDLLTEADAGRSGTDPAILERERSLRHALSVRVEREILLLQSPHTEEQAQAARKEVENLTSKYQEIEAEIGVASPRYASLTRPQPLTLSEIQELLLGPDTLLLEYSLGDEHSYLWAVSKTSILSFELPKRAEIEAVARRVYGLLTARNKRGKDESIQASRLRAAEAEARYPESAGSLSHMLLSPVASLLERKRLLIVSDGALQYLPFGALPSPIDDNRSSDGHDTGMSRLKDATTESNRPLIIDHEIVSVPSASVLGVLRRETAGRTRAEKTLAVLADPVFNPNDERVRTFARARGNAAIADPSQHVHDVARALRDVGASSDGHDLARLPFSRREAEQTMAFVPRGQGTVSLDFKANRAIAVSAELTRYRIVHFATHGLLDSKHPELSGIVLSLVDEHGAPQDGFLRLHDIYGLNLPAELVVLSACQTALGKDIKGEGLVGLTRGFMYAGAARIAASLWQVNDRATAELMSYFYRGMMREGLRPAAALQAAQVEMWKQKRWKSPYYWAAFVLQGEWK